MNLKLSSLHKTTVYIDPDLLDELEVYQNKFNETVKRVIGRTSVYLRGASEFCRFKECNLGNFLTDAYVAYVSSTMYGDITWYTFNYLLCPEYSTQ